MTRRAVLLILCGVGGVGEEWEGRGRGGEGEEKHDGIGRGGNCKRGETGKRAAKADGPFDVMYVRMHVCTDTILGT